MKYSRTCPARPGQVSNTRLLRTTPAKRPRPAKAADAAVVAVRLPRQCDALRWMTSDTLGLTSTHGTATKLRSYGARRRWSHQPMAHKPAVAKLRCSWPMTGNCVIESPSRCPQSVWFGPGPRGWRGRRRPWMARPTTPAQLRPVAAFSQAAAAEERTLGTLLRPERLRRAAALAMRHSTKQQASPAYDKAAAARLGAAAVALSQRSAAR